MMKRQETEADDGPSGEGRDEHEAPVSNLLETAHSAQQPLRLISACIVGHALFPVLVAGNLTTLASTTPGETRRLRGDPSSSALVLIVVTVSDLRRQGRTALGLSLARIEHVMWPAGNPRP
jgi:hypothetical protein